MSVGAYWCPWVPTGVLGCIFVSEWTYWSLKVRTGD